MKKIIFILTLFNLSVSYSQNWKSVSDKSLRAANKFERKDIPKKYNILSTNFEYFKTKIVNAPLVDSGIESNLIINFPTQNSDVEKFKIWEAPVMDAELSAQYPDIKSYVGKGINDPTAIIRFSVTSFGLTSITLSGNHDTTIIEPYTKDLNNYIVFSKSALENSDGFMCNVKSVQSDPINYKESDNNLNNYRINDSKLRKYRIVLASTVEFSTFHINRAGHSNSTDAVKRQDVISAMNVSLTNINAVYETDIAVRFILVSQSSNVIFLYSDSFTNSTASMLIEESKTVIGDAVLSSLYDIGHTLATCEGGIAGVGVTCGIGKARGCSGTSTPVGVKFDINILAHEIGHQFGANHTYNSSSCGVRESGSSFEPGSGSTIMGYAGICTGNNVVNDSNSYFNWHSISQMNTHMLSDDCAPKTTTTNTPPGVESPASYTIPRGTAFKLFGSSTDADVTGYTYCWEQSDAELSTQPPTVNNSKGPNFRSFPPSSQSFRFFPRLEDVLNNDLSPTWEVIPNVARILNFKFTVRDNKRSVCAQTNVTSNRVTVSGVAGPFVVTSQNTTGINWVVGTNKTVTWNVAGTTGNGVNTPSVNIALYVDGAFALYLVRDSANDGSQVVTVPSRIDTNCRIVVSAAGNNVFYAVNSKPFSISSATTLSKSNVNEVSIYPNPSNGEFTVNYKPISKNDLKIMVNKVSGDLVYENTFVNIENFNQTIDLKKLQKGIYIVTILDGAKQIIERIIVD